MKKRMKKRHRIACLSFDDDGEEALSQDSFDMERKEEEIEYDVYNEHIEDEDDNKGIGEVQVRGTDHFAWCQDACIQYLPTALKELGAHQSIM